MLLWWLPRIWWEKCLIVGAAVLMCDNTYSPYQKVHKYIKVFLQLCDLPSTYVSEDKEKFMHAHS